VACLGAGPLGCSAAPVAPPVNTPGERAEWVRSVPMRAVLCVDVEPDERTPTACGARWDGADRLFEDDTWLRSRLSTGVINWFLRIDHQVEVLHGDDCWAAAHYAATLGRLLERGDELGAHPHAWRFADDSWSMCGTDEWSVDNARRALAGFESVFGHAPPSFRYGDRFVSDAVVDLLHATPGVVVDLTLEPGVSTVRGLVPSEPTIGVCRQVDPALSYRYRPGRGALDVPDGDGSLTMVPLTTGLVPGGPVVDTLQLWKEPGEFARMLHLRLLDDGLDHLAFAIRSDLPLHSWAVEHVCRNLDALHQVLPAVEWVRASELALVLGEPAPTGIGLVGAVGRELERSRERAVAVELERDSAELRLAALRDELDELRTVVERLHTVVDEEHEHRRAAECAAEIAAAELGTVRATVTWRLHQRLLPLLRPISTALRRVRRRMSRPGGGSSR
jgi:hypothetical protein